jgi:hypothetical protein
MAWSDERAGGGAPSTSGAPGSAMAAALTDLLAAFFAAYLEEAGGLLTATAATMCSTFSKFTTRLQNGATTYLGGWLLALSRGLGSCGRAVV